MSKWVVEEFRNFAGRLIANIVAATIIWRFIR